MTFTAIGDDNTSIWGSGINMEDSEGLVSIAAELLSNMIPAGTRESLELPTELMGCTITWTSDNPTILSETGEVTPPEEKTKVNLTAEITREDSSVTKEFTVKVLAAKK